MSDQNDGRFGRVAPRKSLGQHFLHDENVLARIAALATPAADSGLLEIGPGTGNLTAFLLEHGRPLVAIERDRRLPEVLAERFGDGLEVMRADAVRVDYGHLLGRADMGPSPVVVGNLPYNVGTQILFAVIESRVRPARIVIMVQREVAKRIVADPGTSAYGLLTVKIGMRADARIALRVRPGAFHPPPKVESAVLVIEPLAEPRHPVPGLDRLGMLLDAGFGQRRKTLANALRNGLGIAGDHTRAALAELGLDARSRAEVLSIRHWAALANLLDPHIPEHATGRRRPRRAPDAAPPRD